jgi:hypothetical protein
MNKSMFLAILFSSNIVIGTIHTIPLPIIGVAAGAGLLWGYQTFKTPGTFTPTIKKINTLTFRPGHQQEPLEITEISSLVKAIYEKKTPSKVHMIINEQPHTIHHGVHIDKNDPIVFIFVRGYAKTVLPGTNDDFIKQGACAKAGWIQLKDNIVPPQVPLITFDIPDDQKNFSFGGPKEVQCLKLVYKKVLQKNPHAKIVLIGDCRGGKVVLEWATTNPKNLEALVLMAPFVSAQDLTHQMADNHVSFLPYHRQILNTFFRAYFPSYDTSKDNLFDRINDINPTIPVFIGHRTQDTLIPNENIARLNRILTQNGNPVHLTTTTDTSKPHSLMTHVPEIQIGVQDFLQQYGLPHKKLA